MPRVSAGTLSAEARICRYCGSGRLKTAKHPMQTQYAAPIAMMRAVMAAGRGVEPAGAEAFQPGGLAAQDLVDDPKYQAFRDAREFFSGLSRAENLSIRREGGDRDFDAIQISGQ